MHRTMHWVYLFNFRSSFLSDEIRLHSIKNNMFRSFKSKENIHKKEDGPDCTVSDYESSILGSDPLQLVMNV